MEKDVFWIDPLEMDGDVATVHACFNEFRITIKVARTDGSTISIAEAEEAYTAVFERIPQRGRERGSD